MIGKTGTPPIIQETIRKAFKDGNLATEEGIKEVAEKVGGMGPIQEYATHQFHVDPAAVPDPLKKAANLFEDGAKRSTDLLKGKNKYIAGGAALAVASALAVKSMKSKKAAREEQEQLGKLQQERGPELGAPAGGPAGLPGLPGGLPAGMPAIAGLPGIPGGGSQQG